MPLYVAQEKGFLKRSGLEAEFVQMNTSIQPQALINGNINFIPSLSAGVPAAVAGMPLVVVMNFYSFTPWTLVTHNDINKPQDLLGKKIGVSGVRTTSAPAHDRVVQESGTERKRSELVFDRGHWRELRRPGQRAGRRRCAGARLMTTKR